MVKAAPASAFVMTQSEFLLEFLIIPFDAPFRPRLSLLRAAARAFEPPGRATGPLAIRPGTIPRAAVRSASIPMRRPDADGGEALGERCIGALTPSDDAPGALWQSLVVNELPQAAGSAV